MTSSPDPRHSLESLIEHFEQNLSTIKSPQYNEMTVRREFIDPFFALLGWDMDNRQGYAEAYKDVIHEDAIKVGGYTKAPDYCFRIGGTRKFFVEAKKPAVNVKDDPEPAFQLRRYAWSAKLPLSILTDFEELAVYDCRSKPSIADKSAIARVQYIHYRDYPARWEEIASIFSREAILKGSFDRYAESAKGKRGTSEVDKAFLSEIEAWRDALARNLALRNPSLSTRDLNYAVQTTIDRIIFLRICEDRGIEDYGRLMALRNGEAVYPRLMELFRRANERYNSGLFHFEPEKGRAEAPDALTPALAVDDKVLKEMIKGLYYPESPYEFSVLPADILGQVYEQFLGKVIRLTAGHQAKVEDKPEVKKAGGVYYTPTYIVDYIVKNTVGKMVEGKAPAEVAGEKPKGAHPLRVLDPACGSGSFLLGAYQYLLTWYRDQYVADGAEKWAKGKEPRLYQVQGGEWKLTTSERKRILLNHIYGVDIDSQAVEVTKLSLLLKVLEGETNESVSHQRLLFHERALPDLSRNIKCGNSLIGSDFYKGKLLASIDEEERARINAFDWEEEFPEVFSGRNKSSVQKKPVGAVAAQHAAPGKGTEKGFTAEGTEEEKGFDVVIGNPPYGRDILSQFKTYFDEHYESSQYKVDSFVLFIEKGILLLRREGLYGMIVPNTWLNTESFSKLRQFLTSRHITEIFNLGKNIFFKANIDTMLLFAANENGSLVKVFDSSSIKSKGESRLGNPCRSFLTDSREWARLKDCKFSIHAEPNQRMLFERIKSYSKELGELAEISQGLIPYNTKELSERNPYLSDRKHGKEWKPLLDKGACIARFSLMWNGVFVKFGPWLYTANNPKFYENPKILIQRHRNPSLSRRIIATLDEDHFYYKDNLCGIILKDCLYSLRFLLGIINSSLMNEYYRKSFTEVSLNPTYLRRLPIASLDLATEKGKSLHDAIVDLVDQMLSIQQKLSVSKTEQDMGFLKRQITAIDKEIDRLVYDLYHLNAEEIAIVESPSS